MARLILLALCAFGLAFAPAEASSFCSDPAVTMSNCADMAMSSEQTANMPERSGTTRHGLRKDCCSPLCHAFASVALPPAVNVAGPKVDLSTFRIGDVSSPVSFRNSGLDPPPRA